MLQVPSVRGPPEKCGGRNWRRPHRYEPEFALRPPKPGAPRPNEQQSSDVAHSVLFQGEAATGHTSSTRGEKLLLSDAGALDASSSIREVLNAETEKVEVTEEEDRSFFDRIFFWRGPDSEEETLASADKKAAEVAAEENAERERRKGWF